jgi:hypothetical protein
LQLSEFPASAGHLEDHDPGRRRRGEASLFLVLFPFPDNILKLTAGSLERVPYCHVDILMGPVCRGFAAHRNVGSIGNHEMNLDVKNTSLVVAVLWPGNNDACADDSPGKLLELLDFLSDASFDGVRMLNAIECDL